MNLAERLWSRVVEQPNGCREWTGSTNSKGYGVIGVDYKTVLTHRLAWTLTNGPIPEGMKVLHHCDNPSCCNVGKCLFLGTMADNTADMVAKGRCHNKSKTHCVNDHPYDEANTYVDSHGWRQCRICKRARAAKAAA